MCSNDLDVRTVFDTFDCQFIDRCTFLITLHTLLKESQYLNRRYNSVRLLEMVVPERNIAPKFLPDRSCMVRMAKSIFKARCEPSGLPKPDTRSWRVLNIRFLT